MKRSDKNIFVQSLKEELKDSSTVIVTHYSGLSVDETDDLRKAMRANGAKFKVTKNRLTKIALADTQFKSISDLFDGPTAIAYSTDPIVPAKIAVEFEKKLEKFKIIGGYFEGENIDTTKINYIATLPSIDEIRGKLVGLISAPAQKLSSVIQAPCSQLARLIAVREQKLSESN